ncbi:hypothetical protein JCM10908_006546 [Rhodotorula pacifica]|uniref:glycosylphosphatidylinositol-alpha 1,2 mannosyltransferase n=1 Tax=Rhodotorula pacifica TaxID=1495444 RepID=UPI003173D4D1
MRRPGRRFVLIYAGLALLRILIAFTSTSVIHPDEHFQNPEIAAGAVFEYGGGIRGDGPLRTWEWGGPTPARSIVPVFGSTGIAFWLVRTLWDSHPSVLVLFAAERGVMLLFSFFIDWLLWRTSSSHQPTLLLFATSPITFTFLLRPFSNSLETLCLALLLYLTYRAHPLPSVRTATIVGAVVAFGCFVRVTFVAFALPACVHLLASTIRTGRSRYIVARILASMTFGAIVTTALCVYVDSWYFTSAETADARPTWPILTPLNLLRYNLSPDNLKDHGLHPRYLHLLVNWPMLFGVGIVAVVSAATSARRQRQARKVRFQDIPMPLYLAALVLPTLVLSIQPHQEPRFLIPLLGPLVLLAGRSPLVSAENGPSKRRRTFWGLWLTHSALFTLFFGYLHQGGLLPTLFELNAHLRSGTAGDLGALRQVDLVFWRTFMPPRHLLLPLSSGEQPHPIVHVTDLAGAEQRKLFQTLAQLTSDAPPSSAAVAALRRCVLLIAPAYSPGLAELACPVEQQTASVETMQRSVCIQPLWPHKPTFGVHVDMDRLDDLVRGGFSVRGVGVWEVKAVGGDEGPS